MTMATVQFYNNPYHYPDFKATLTPLTSQVSMTPKNTSTKGGTLHLSGEWGELSTYNYVCIRRNNQTTWAWVDTVRERGANACEVEYIVDAFRTYRNQITTGVQHLERVPFATELYDGLLSSTQQAHNLESRFLPWGNYRSRVLVVQIRRATSGDVVSNTPAQPSPYNFYFTTFDPEDWYRADAEPGTPSKIGRLLDALTDNAQSHNVVTLYTIPYMNITSFPTTTMYIHTGSGSIPIEGFKFMPHNVTNVSDLAHRSRDIKLTLSKSELLKRNHAVRVVVPDAGVLQVPDEAIELGNIKLRQDVDIFSGASNYMLTAGENDLMIGHSIRGSSISSIPILSDPYETYISQNQNALATSLIGDVANVGVGIAGTAMGNPLGMTQVASGMTGLINRRSNLRDAQNAIPSNPTSLLGSALVGRFGNGFWLIEQYEDISNASMVNTQYGYPYEMIGNLTIPNKGYIQTSNCSIGSSGRVPNWAIQDINSRFDSGLRVI